METGYRTPLLDYFRRGDVPRDVKAMAARGELAPRGHEQLLLLMLLTEDRDAEIAELASSTVRAIPPEVLGAFLARSDVPSEARSFFEARSIAPAIGQVPLDHPEQPLFEAPMGVLAGRVDDADRDDLPAGTAAVDGGEVRAESRAGAVQIASLTVPEKLKLAMRGTREQRAVLIRDSNRLVAAAVLSGPKLTESEVENFARMANVADEVLRVIGSSRVWTRNYAVASALVKNPKTPPAIALTLLPRLNERDVKFVATDRGVAEAVRLAARKALAASQARRS